MFSRRRRRTEEPRGQATIAKVDPDLSRFASLGEAQGEIARGRLGGLAAVENHLVGDVLDDELPTAGDGQDIDLTQDVSSSASLGPFESDLTPCPGFESREAVR